MTTACAACHDYPVTDTFVCQRCMDTLHGHIAEIPGLARELATDVAKLGRKGDGQPHALGGIERPLIFDPHAASVLDNLKAALVGAIRVIALDQPGDMPANRVSAMCAWLARREASIALRPEGGDICAEIARARKQARRTVDLRPERVYIGDCDCAEGVGLYAIRSHPDPRTGERAERIHTCRECGHGWLIEQRLAELHEECRDYLITQADVVAIIRAPRTTVSSWVARGRLVASGTNLEGADLYRYGDALDLNEARQSRAG